MAAIPLGDPQSIQKMIDGERDSVWIQLPMMPINADTVGLVGTQFQQLKTCGASAAAERERARAARTGTDQS
jgi:hypothetical protein